MIKRNQPSQVPPLDDRHYLAIKLLVNQRRLKLTREQIAKRCGVSRMQLYRWEKRQDFQQEFSKACLAACKRPISREHTHVGLALKGDMRAVREVLTFNDFLR